MSAICSHGVVGGACRTCLSEAWRDLLKLRYLLWCMHPCIGKYGDDGEMQCPCGIDFRRDSVDVIERKTVEMNMRKLAASNEEKP